MRQKFEAVEPEIKENWRNKHIKISFYPSYIINSDELIPSIKLFYLVITKKVVWWSYSSCSSPVVESCSCQDHGVVIGPLGGVAPPRPGRVPVVAPRWITNDTLRKALPHNESKVHLEERDRLRSAGKSGYKNALTCSTRNFLFCSTGTRLTGSISLKTATKIESKLFRPVANI